MNKWIRWFVSAAFGLLFVLYIPELALMIMAIPFGGMSSDPYISVMLMFVASFASVFVIANAAEVAVILCTMAISGIIVRWLQRVALRDAILKGT